MIFWCPLGCLCLLTAVHGCSDVLRLSVGFFERLDLCFLRLDRSLHVGYGSSAEFHSVLFSVTICFLGLMQ